MVYRVEMHVVREGRVNEPTSAQLIDRARRAWWNNVLFWLNGAGVLVNLFNYHRTGRKIFFAFSLLSLIGCWTTKD